MDNKAPSSPVYSVDPNEVLRFQLERAVKNLFKGYLVLLEDLGDSHDAALAKLRAALPEQYRPFVDLADDLTPEHGVLLRKKVLDAGNDVLREISKLLEQFNVEFTRR
jgi:hypothetical protein